MKPYSKRELRGIFLLALVCLACIALGVLSRHGFFSDYTADPKSEKIIMPVDTLSQSQGESEVKLHSANSAGKTHRQNKSQKKSPSARRASSKGSPAHSYPVRDVLADTIR